MDLLTVDESKLNRPVPCDLRTGPEACHVHRLKTESVAMYEASVDTVDELVGIWFGEYDTSRMGE